MAEQVVNVPLLGGIDESVDPDQLKAPGMKELTNVVVRKKERFQKREGYSLLAEVGTTTTPATAYSTGAPYAMPVFSEAIAGHKSETGSKIVVADDGQVFEFVNQDSLRGYRYVNQLPRALGTVIPVDTAAGQCLEIESCIIKSGTDRLRVTAWTVGQRPEAIACDDSMWRRQAWDASGLYVAIQREDTGAFLSQPFRVKTPAGIDTTDVRNLRICECYPTNLGPNGDVSCVVAWQSGVGASAKLYGFRIAEYGEKFATIDIFALVGTAFTDGLPPTFRSFDIAPMWSSQIGALPGLAYNIFLAICSNDTVTPNIDWHQLDTSGSLFWLPVANALPFAGATASATWTAKCMRGIVIQSNKFEADSYVTLTARVGVADAPGPAPAIDMALVTFLMEPKSPLDGTWVDYPDSWGIIRDMNYQTLEDFSTIPAYAATGGKFYPSKTVRQFNGSDFLASPPFTVNTPLSLNVREVAATPYLLEAVLPDGTSQIYDVQWSGSGPVGSDSRQVVQYMSGIAPYVPTGLTNTQYNDWSPVPHSYPASLELPVNLADVAVYNFGGATGRQQLSYLETANCGNNNRFSATPAGFYPSRVLTTSFAGATVVTPPTADVWVSGGIDSDVGFVSPGPWPTGLTNGVYVATVNVAGNTTGLCRFTVSGGTVTAVSVVDSGIGMTPGVGVPINVGANALYPGSPEMLSTTTGFACNVTNYITNIVPKSLGVYTRPTSPSIVFIQFGVCTAVSTLVGTLNANAQLRQFAQKQNKTYGYTFLDGGDTSNPLPSPAFALTPENCVHRWSSAVSTGDYTVVLLAVASTAANPYTTAAVDAPLSVPFVHSTNNYFETYKWVPAPGAGETVLRPRWPSATTSNGISALAGPWRLVSDMALIQRPSLGTIQDFNKHRAVVAITPTGDDAQRSQYLVYIGDSTQEMIIESPPNDLPPESLDWKYRQNKGMFVESLNAPRVLTIPMNSPRLFSYEKTEQRGAATFTRTTNMCAGMLRDGSSENTVRVGAISYDVVPERWRSAMSYADYTLFSGGVVSSFDGASCGEITPMMWPQRALCTVAYDSPPTVFDMDKQYSIPSTDYNPKSSLWAAGVGAGGIKDVAALMNISRPYFAYEAGIKAAAQMSGYRGTVDWSGYDSVTTSFGGKPTSDYQSITVDQRLTSYKMNSAVNGNTAPGGAKPVYFYGKYGKYAESYNASVGGSFSGQNWIAWVPRNTSSIVGGGNSTPLESSFDSENCQGDMLMRWVYETTDGTGRVSKSAPSIPSRWHILSRLFTDENKEQVAAEVYKYGFFAPRLELTNRLRVGGDDNRRVTLQAYTTAEPFGSVFYRTPLRNWESPATAFASERGSNRQLCSFVVRPYTSTTSSAPYGFVTNNLSCFHGMNGEYLGILGMPYLYTTGGEVANMCPPSARCMTVHQNRIVLGGADDATVIWIGKEMTEQDAPAFSDLLTIRIADGGAVTGLGSLSRALIVFKADQIHILTGDMPDNTVSGGLTASLGQPMRLVNGLGCISHRSVISTPVGVFFQSYRTIELMGQDLAVTPIGLRVMDILEEYKNVVSVTHKAVDSEVIFCCQKPSVLNGSNTQVDGRQFVLLVYNYAEDIWSRHELDGFGIGPASVAEMNDQTLVFVEGKAYITSDTRFYDTTATGDQWVTMSGETAPIALNQQQGYQRVKRIVLMGDPTPSLPAPSTYQPHAMTVTVSTDWDSTQNATWTSAEVQSILAKQGREFFGVHVRNQKCQKVSIRFQDAPPTGGAITTGYGVAFSNIALTVGVKSGLNKRMTQEAEH